RFVTGTLFTAAKIAIMITIIGYGVFFVLAALVALIAAAVAAEDAPFDGGILLELVALPFRLAFEAMIYLPDWFFWGTGADHTPRRSLRKKAPAYERVFQFLFGPPTPRL